MRKKKCKKCPACPPAEKWAVPTADFFSLLLALFIALFAIASVNKEKVSALKSAFAEIYEFTPKAQQTVPVLKMDSKPGETKKEGTDDSIILNGQKSILEGGSGTSKDKQQQAAAIAQAVLNVRKMIEDQKKGSNITLEESENGFVINLPASLAFKGASAVIENEDAIQFIKNISTIAKQLPPNTDILVNGYTDDLPPTAGSQFKDNWQLSSARALSVVQELMKDGINGNKLGAVGYGQYRPLSPNDSEDNRQKNRRVTISFVAKQDAAPSLPPKNILDQKSSALKP
ncbi:MAG: OmpA family protein [Thiovulaceae bacterium]|nr:OmpA family protein [Sulfurimonadaceae bacterium]